VLNDIETLLIEENTGASPTTVNDPG
jgi:hypothetical protein